MKDIKTREIKKDIKVLDKTKVGLAKTKDSLLRNKSRSTSNNEEENLNEFTIIKSKEVLMLGKNVSTRQIRYTKKQLKQEPQNVDNYKKLHQERIKRKVKKDSKKNSDKSIIKSKENITIKTKIDIAKNSKEIKSSPKSIKMNKVKIKNSNTTKSATNSTLLKVGKITDNSQMKEKAVKRIKNVTKSVINAIKRMIAYSKLLIVALTTAGSVIITIILIITMVGMIISSPLAIFFGNDDGNTSSTMTLNEAIIEINADYQNEIEKIKTDNSYDELDVSGSRANWKDVLSIYAVKTVKDDEIDVATMDDERLEILKDVFWDMNEITYSLENITRDEVTVTDDGNGNLVETTKSVTKSVLKITTKHKTLEEMAKKYHFDGEQKEQLNEMLSDESDDTWTELLYGISIGNGNSAIVNIAIAQLSNIGGQTYWSWYGFTTRVEWCAIFVSWCADQAGYIDIGIIPKFALCEKQGVAWFKERGLWQESGYIPNSGDIIFFDWESDGHSDHVGIVEKVENDIVYTIEGNSNANVNEMNT